MILIIDYKKAVWKHLVGMDSLNATEKLSFEKNEHANHFIKHYNGQDNYKEAMPVDENVNFSVYHQIPNGKEHKDDMRKPINWKPFII